VIPGRVGGFGMPGAFPYRSYYYGGYYGYDTPFYGGGYYGPNIDPIYVPVPVVPQDPPVAVSGSLPARLTIEFPAPAEVWVNGQKVEGDPATTWALESPVLGPGESYTYRVRARWQANGQTYEYTKEVTLKTGQRSNLTVYSGTAVSDK
jgi:uncharacterized protein (TIGR03000 family)